MRFRRKDWDVAMPAELVAYWTAWNESDLDCVRAHLASAVTTDVEWNDPRDSFVGIDELEAASGLVARMDGFFGHPTPIDDSDSGIPAALRPGI